MSLSSEASSDGMLVKLDGSGSRTSSIEPKTASSLLFIYQLTEEVSLLRRVIRCRDAFHLMTSVQMDPVDVQPNDLRTPLPIWNIQLGFGTVYGFCCFVRILFAMKLDVSLQMTAIRMLSKCSHTLRLILILSTSDVKKLFLA